MNIETIRQIVRQESPSRIFGGTVVSADPRGTRTATVRDTGGHVHSRVLTCTEDLGVGDQVIVARLARMGRLVVLGKVASCEGSSLSAMGVLAPPSNFTVLAWPAMVYAQWDTYPGECLSWEVQYSLTGSPYSDAAQMLVSRGSYYLYPCAVGTTVHMRVRAVRWIGDNNLMRSAWTGWASASAADYEVPRLLVELTNKAGKQVLEGWVVAIDKANASSFKTTIGADDEDVIGVAFETIADNAVGLVCISGLIDVYVSDVPAIGDYLISSITEGNATGDVTATKGTFGRALTTKVGSVVTAIIDPPFGASAGVSGHNLLSAEHPDTLADAVVQGDMAVGSATPLWKRLPKGTADWILKMNAGGTDPEWGEPPITSIAGHVRGSIFRGEAADWGIYTAETDKQILVGDGTDIVSVPVSLDVILANTGAATVVGIQARTVGGAAPADGQVYAWDAGANEWKPVDQTAAAADLGIGGNPTFKADGVPIVISGVDGAYVCPGAGEVTAAYVYSPTPGTAGSTIIDVNLNGVTIFTVQGNRPTLAWNDADGVAKSGVPNVVTLAENDVLTVDIDQVATGVSGLSVVISLAGGGGIIMIEIQEDDVKVTDVTTINFEGEGNRVTDEGGNKATVALGMWELIEEQVLVGSAATVTFAAIPQTYRALVLKIDARTDNAAEDDNVCARFNADVGNNYDMVQIWATGAGGLGSSAERGLARVLIGIAEGANSRASNFAPNTIELPNYARTDREKWMMNSNEGRMGDVSADLDMTITTRRFRWRSTAAITTILLYPSTGANFVTGCVFTLYGVL